MSEQRDEGIDQAEQIEGYDQSSDNEFTPEVWERLVELEHDELHEQLERSES